MNTTTTAPPFIPFANYRFTLLDGAVVAAGLLQVIVFVLAILAAIDHMTKEDRTKRRGTQQHRPPQCGPTQEEVILSPVEVVPHSPIEVADAPGTVPVEGLPRLAIDTAGGTTIPQYIQGDIDHHVIDTTLDSSETTEVFFGEPRIPSSYVAAKKHGHLCLSADGSTWADIISNNGDYEDDNVFVDQVNSSLQESTIRLSTFMPTDNTSVTRGSLLDQHVNPAFVPDDRESIDSGRSSKHESELSGFRPKEHILLADVHRYQGNSGVQHVELSVDTGLPVTPEDLLPTTGQLRRNSSAYKSTVNNPPGSYFFPDRQSFTSGSRTSSMNARYMERRASQSHSLGSSSFRWVDMGEDFPYGNVVDDYGGTEMCVDTGRTFAEQNLHDQMIKANSDPIRHQTHHEVVSNPTRSAQIRLQGNINSEGEFSAKPVDDTRHSDQIELSNSDRQSRADRQSRVEEVVNVQNRYQHVMDGNYNSGRNSSFRGDTSKQEQCTPDMPPPTAKQGEQIGAYAVTNSPSEPYGTRPEVRTRDSLVRTNKANARPFGESLPLQISNVVDSGVRHYENLPQGHINVTHGTVPTSPQTHYEVNTTNASSPQIRLVHMGRGFVLQTSESTEANVTQDTKTTTARPPADIPHKQSHVQSSSPILTQHENLPNTRDSVQSNISEFRPYENLPDTQGAITTYRNGSMPYGNDQQADTRFKVDDVSSSGPYETLPAPRAGVGNPGVQIQNQDLKRNAGSERGSYRQALAGRFEDKTSNKKYRTKSISKAKRAKASKPQPVGKHPRESANNTQPQGEVGRMSNIQIYENHIQVRAGTAGGSESHMGQGVQLRRPEGAEGHQPTPASYQPRHTDGVREPDRSIPLVAKVQRSNTFTNSPGSGQLHGMPRRQGVDVQVNSVIVAKGEKEIMV